MAHYIVKYRLFGDDKTAVVQLDKPDPRVFPLMNQLTVKLKHDLAVEKGIVSHTMKVIDFEWMD